MRAGFIANTNEVIFFLFTESLNRQCHTVLEDEAWGFRAGLKKCIDQQILKIKVECDSSILVQLLTNQMQAPWPVNNLIEDCKALLSSFLTVEIMHVYRFG